MDTEPQKVLIKYKSKTYAIISFFCFVAACIFSGIGFDKMINYYNPDSSYLLSHNAYVGGDAYNYIINGTYATAYFVLSMGFMLIGGIWILIHIHANSQYEIIEQNERIIQALRISKQESPIIYSSNNSSNELPEL